MVSSEDRAKPVGDVVVVTYLSVILTDLSDRMCTQFNLEIMGFSCSV